MGIRWRLGLVTVQLAALLMGTWLATGAPWQNEIWFFSGLLALFLSRQLLEPYFPRPSDTLVNSTVALLLIAVAQREVAAIGWAAAALLIALALLLSLIAQVLGRASRPFDRIGRAARLISTRATAVTIYSVIFFLALAESFALSEEAFWTLTITWLTVVIIGAVNWEAAWSATKKSNAATIVGFLGPSRIVFTTDELPETGAAVTVRKGSVESKGVLVRRIRRPNDIYGEVHLGDDPNPELFLSGQIEIEQLGHAHDVIGVVDHGSTDRTLRFTATRELAVGEAVFVPRSDETELIYQVIGAQLERRDARDGANLETACTALQLGLWDPMSRRIRRYPWVAPAGSSIFASSLRTYPIDSEPPQLRLGELIGSRIPIEINLDEASTGHVLVLGMTKMGKTTLSLHLASALAATRPVVILDQTGEYRSRHSVPTCTAQTLVTPSLSLKEPDVGEVGPAVALEFFEKLLNQLATEEYEDGSVRGRTVVLEEAHQFIPEPAGLGFGTPGRDEAYKLGTLMMQVRKYGLSVILISQRTAVVGKSALSQCENIIAFRSVDRTGLDYLEGIMGSEAIRLLPRLEQGQAIVAGPAFNADEPLAVRISTLDLRDPVAAVQASDDETEPQ